MANRDDLGSGGSTATLPDTNDLKQKASGVLEDAKGQAKDKWDTLDLGAAIPGANESLETIALTKEQNPCSM